MSFSGPETRRPGYGLTYPDRTLPTLPISDPFADLGGTFGVERLPPRAGGEDVEELERSQGRPSDDGVFYIEI